MIMATKHVKGEQCNNCSAEAAKGSRGQGHARAYNELAVCSFACKASNNEAKVAGVDCRGASDGDCYDGNVEREEPDGLEEASEEADEGAYCRARTQDEGLVVAMVEMLGDLGEDGSCNDYPYEP